MSDVKRRSLKELRCQHDISSQVVAEQAGVPLREEYLLEIGVPVERQTALKILNAFSRLVNQTYTLDDIWVSIKKEEGI